jgi:hypothetical protein
MNDLMLTSLFIIVLSNLAMFGLIKLNRTPKIVKALKEKLMYSSVFRGQI